MATVDFNPTAHPTHLAEKPSYQGFSNSLCGDVFRAQSVLEATRVMLAQVVSTDDGQGMHIDNLLLDIDGKMQALVGRLNDSLKKYKGSENGQA